MKLNKKQIETINMLISKGGVVDIEGLPNVVYIFGRCLLVLDTGVYEEL